VEFRFRSFAQKLLRKSKVQAENGERSRQYVKTMSWAILNADWGLMDYFGEKDVREVRTHTWQEYRKRPVNLTLLASLPS